MNGVEAFGGFIIKAAITLLATALTVTVGGAVFQQLWEWFVAVRFHVGTIQLAEAVGLVALVRFASFTYTRQTDEKRGWLETLVESTFVSLMLSGITLTVGAIAHASLV